MNARPTKGKKQADLVGAPPEEVIDWKALNARLAAADVEGRAEQTPDSIELVGDLKKGPQRKVTRRPGFKEKFRVVSPGGKILALGYSPSDAVAAAIHLWGKR